ncbi:MAG: hypothetical protein QNJ98_03030 [Planctomycetota bacterium]|nr:hypothetical protein [Planctomycetota bacterium]
MTTRLLTALTIALLCAGCACCGDPCGNPCGADDTALGPAPVTDAPPADAPPGPTDADGGSGPAIVGSGGRYDG